MGNRGIPEEYAFLTDYEKYLKKNYFFDTKKDLDNDELFSFFFFYENKDSSNTLIETKKELSPFPVSRCNYYYFIDLFKRIFFSTMMSKDSNYINNLKRIIHIFFDYYSSNINGFNLSKENFKEISVFNNYFYDVLEKIKIYLILNCSSLSKINISKKIYTEILTVQNFNPLNVFYRFLKEAGFQNEKEICSKKFFINFYSFYGFQYKFGKEYSSGSIWPVPSYKEIIFEKKNEDELISSLLIDKNFPFIYSSKNYKEEKILSLEKKAFKTALKKFRETEKGKKIVLTDNFIIIKNIKHWDVMKPYDRRFMLYEKDDTNFKIFKEQLCEKNQSQYIYYILIFIYFLSLKKIYGLTICGDDNKSSVSLLSFLYDNHFFSS